jgi:hypothetical protein
MGRSRTWILAACWRSILAQEWERESTLFTRDLLRWQRAMQRRHLL